MDFGSSLDSERSNPPPPSLLHRGDPEISMCVPCCTCVRACCGPPMTGLAGQLGGVLGRWESESHQPCAHVEPHSGACTLPGDLGTGLYMLTYAGLDLSSPLGAKGLGFLPQKSSDPAPCLSNGKQEGADKFISSLWAHGLWIASQHLRYKRQIPHPLTPVQSPFWLLEESGGSLYPEKAHTPVGLSPGGVGAWGLAFLEGQMLQQEVRQLEELHERRGMGRATGLTETSLRQQGSRLSADEAGAGRRLQSPPWRQKDGQNSFPHLGAGTKTYLPQHLPLHPTPGPITAMVQTHPRIYTQRLMLASLCVHACTRTHTQRGVGVGSACEALMCNEKN